MHYPAIRQLLEFRTRELSFVKRYTTSFLTNFLPRRIKRLIFLASVYGFIFNVHEIDKNIINKINHVMKLAPNHANALLLPIEYRTGLWNTSNHFADIDEKIAYFKDLYNDALKCSDFLKLAQFFVQNAPIWMIYGSDRLIARELEILFRNFD